MEANIKTHHPNDLLVKCTTTDAVIMPGHLVTHTDDSRALGMVIGRMSSSDETVCAVLWSRRPSEWSRRPSESWFDNSVPKSIPIQESWTQTVRKDGSITYDVEAVYEQSQATQSMLTGLARGANKTDITLTPQGLLLVKRYDVMSVPVQVTYEVT